MPRERCNYALPKRTKITKCEVAHAHVIPFLSRFGWFAHLKILAWNRYWEPHPEYLNKPCEVELVTSRNRDYRTLSHSRAFIFFIYYREFTDGFVRVKPLIDFLKAWFSKHMLPFPSIFQINITIICSQMLLIHFFCYFGKGRRFLPSGAYPFLTSSVHVPLDTVFNQIW